MRSIPKHPTSRLKSNSSFWHPKCPEKQIIPRTNSQGSLWHPTIVVVKEVLPILLPVHEDLVGFTPAVCFLVPHQDCQIGMRLVSPNDGDFVHLQNFPNPSTKTNLLSFNDHLGEMSTWREGKSSSESLRMVVNFKASVHNSSRLSVHLYFTCW